MLQQLLVVPSFLLLPTSGPGLILPLTYAFDLRQISAEASTMPCVTSPEVAETRLNTSMKLARGPPKCP